MFVRMSLLLKKETLNCFLYTQVLDFDKEKGYP